MRAGGIRIGVVAPGGRLAPAAGKAVLEQVERLYPAGEVEVVFHPQCFLAQGHFAGTDAERLEALVEVANDPSIDAVWFARGGYGTCRIAEAALARFGPAARDKAWLGYSDLGMLLGGLYRVGYPRLAHGPMPGDVVREGGEAAIARALAWLAEGDADALEPSLAKDARPAAAFNLTILSHLLGTALQPDLSGHVLLLEEVAEPMYRIDRALFHVTSDANIRGVAGIRMGRCDPVTPNEPDFGQLEMEVARFWCERSGIPFLGEADIGHDVGNKVVPFGSR